MHSIVGDNTREAGIAHRKPLDGKGPNGPAGKLYPRLHSLRVKFEPSNILQSRHATLEQSQHSSNALHRLARARNLRQSSYVFPVVVGVQIGNEACRNISQLCGLCSSKSLRYEHHGCKLMKCDLAAPQG